MLSVLPPGVLCIFLSTVSYLVPANQWRVFLRWIAGSGQEFLPTKQNFYFVLLFLCGWILS